MTLPSTPSSTGTRRRLLVPEPYYDTSTKKPPSSPRVVVGTAGGGAGSSSSNAPPRKGRRRPAALLVVGAALVTAAAAFLCTWAASRRVIRHRRRQQPKSASATEVAAVPPPTSSVRSAPVRQQEGDERQRQQRDDPSHPQLEAPARQEPPRPKSQGTRGGGGGGGVETTNKQVARPDATSPKSEIKESDEQFHVVFSTDCSGFVGWQSYVFFHRARVVRQPGTVTWIASGCTPQARQTLQSAFDDQIATMTVGLPGTTFRIHFTPSYTHLKGVGEPYKYFNKPFGVRHWMENALNYGLDDGQGANPHDRTIVVLVDPDELLLRPFSTNDFSDVRWVRRPQRGGHDSQRQKEPPTSRWTRVEPGKPIGQLYGYELQWKDKINMTRLVAPNQPASPVDRMSDEDALEGYVVGPPLLATARDMYKIVSQWTQFVPLVHDQYPHLLAEMFAYSLASAHLTLSHQTSLSLMMSDATSSPREEDWSYVDGLDDDTLCRHEIPTQHGAAGPGAPVMPLVLHYCQEYGVGYWFFSKYHMPHNFLTCEHPLFRLPPYDLAASALRANLTHYVSPDGTHVTSTGPNWVRRNAFATCALLRMVNDAASYYKSRHCSLETRANVDETFTLHPADRFPPLRERKPS